MKPKGSSLDPTWKTTRKEPRSASSGEETAGAGDESQTATAMVRRMQGREAAIPSWTLLLRLQLMCHACMHVFRHVFRHVIMHVIVHACM
jgi:hypothetical protein